MKENPDEQLDRRASGAIEGKMGAGQRAIDQVEARRLSGTGAARHAAHAVIRSAATRHRTASAEAGQRKIRNNVDFDEPHLQVADRGSRRAGFPLLRAAIGARPFIL